MIFIKLFSLFDCRMVNMTLGGMFNISKEEQKVKNKKEG